VGETVFEGYYLPFAECCIKMVEGCDEMGMINGVMHRYFTVKMLFDREVEESEFDKITQEVPDILIEKGAAEKSSNGHKFKITSTEKEDGDIETLLNFTLILSSPSSPERLRRNVIEKVLQEHYTEAEVSVLVD
jgi:hypothetical protein